MKAVTRPQRVRLQQAVRLYVAKDGNEALNYDKIRPEESRKLPTALVTPETPEKYVAFGSTLFTKYDIQLDEEAYPRVTSNTQLPAGHAFPEVSEFSFRRELIKLHNFHDGSITPAMAEMFLPPEHRGNLYDPAAAQFKQKLVQTKNQFRKRIIKDTMLPLVLFWVLDDRYLELDTTTVSARMAYFKARIQEDVSVVYWWLRPLASILNLKYLFQTVNPNDGGANAKRNLIRYITGRMLFTADLVYKHLVDHDPIHGYGFQRDEEAVSTPLLYRWGKC
ncbi:hypothetical protein ONS95_003010 [Cadophora gregata]|uniref:uncharacterized protein n=1 Tax=Cadophora gregata TaxID=51156 RepID=UPI0026DBDAA6|nr:uncharacterized protein ONS95_003010 [Cadophora gregata]KAK0108188.1 hypothetical protein ONS95_003010 [Cadophora gregata]